MTAAIAGRSSGQVRSLRLALNRHLHEVIVQSSALIDPAAIGAASMTMITEPVDVSYHDPADPSLDVTLPTARFAAVEQAAGWVYGIIVNPQ